MLSRTCRSGLSLAVRCRAGFHGIPEPATLTSPKRTRDFSTEVPSQTLPDPPKSVGSASSIVNKSALQAAPVLTEKMEHEVASYIGEDVHEFLSDDHPALRAQVEKALKAAGIPDSDADITEAHIASTIVHGRSWVDPYYHPRTHGIPSAVLHLRSYHLPLLILFSHFAQHAASALGIPISKPTPLPVRRNLWTVIRGPFAHKKSQENFERRTYKRVIKAWDADHEVVDRWMRYMEKHVLAGVGMRMVRWDRAPVGVGHKIAETVKADMKIAQAETSQERIKALGEKILQQELMAAAAVPETKQSAAR